MTSTSRTPAPVLIAGGGPIGLTTAALLAKYGIASIVIEADESYCVGSRAICVSRRSQEILGWIGADAPLAEKGLPWTGGRSYFRNEEVLHFLMATEPGERFAPMVNIQQYYAEQYAHEALRQYPGLCEVRWSTRVVAVRQSDNGVQVDIEAADGKRETLSAAWLVACDGGRSTVREQLGLSLQGTQYEGRYVIVDIEQDSQHPVERLAWFDPPSNPGSTILMHRQPDNIWRIDYQIRDDEDPAEAVKPENVLPRVRNHLEMIGETAPWKPLWISIYNAKCLTLNSYWHQRVLFAGDAGHLVPIFGVRGMNSGLDDASNLAWKLALVIQDKADTSLLDSYSFERVQATRENIAYGSKSTEFMAPPHFGFVLMREAALRLASCDERVRPLINPRQSTPVHYAGSALNLTGQEALFNGGAAAGATAPDASLQALGHITYLSQRFGNSFVALYFSSKAAIPAALSALSGSGLSGLEIIRIAPSGAADAQTLIDRAGDAYRKYGAAEGTLYLIRPDGYVLGRWRDANWTEIAQALATYRRH